MLKKILLGLLSFIVVLVAIMVVKTLTFTSMQKTFPKTATLEVSDLAVKRFQGGIQFPTISYGDAEKFDSAAFYGFHQYVKESYPLVDSLLTLNVVGGFTLLYEWRGKDSETKPALIYSHYDVVPVDSATLDDWKADPFSGDIVDGHIYGRGTLDDKVGVFGTLEAVEQLLSEGFVPARTLYFGFGHDEEIGGNAGAASIVTFLQERNVQLEFSLDEGAPMIKGVIPGTDRQIALIGTAEKGYVSYKLTINTPGGHSSSPTPDNTVASLARAIVKLEDNQFPYLVEPVEQQLRYLGAEMPFLIRMMFANTWLTKGAILGQLNAHTTTVATMLEGGVKDNVIPTTASAVVNFRIMPGQSVQDVYDHITEVVDDERITVEMLSEGGNEPSGVSSIDSKAFMMLERTLKEVHGDVIVSPFLVPGGTDSKHFVKVADDSYRFNPARITSIEEAGFHGLNEHVSVEAFKAAVQFFYQFIKNVD